MRSMQHTLSDITTHSVATQDTFIKLIHGRFLVMYNITPILAIFCLQNHLYFAWHLMGQLLLNHQPIRLYLIVKQNKLHQTVLLDSSKLSAPET